MAGHLMDHRLLPFVPSIEMVSNGTLPGKGFLKQEEIHLSEFLKTRNGRLYNSEPDGGKPIKQVM